MIQKYPYVCSCRIECYLKIVFLILQGCTIYVSLFPCMNVWKPLFKSGIKEIIYEDEKYKGTDSDRAAKRMLDAAGVKYTKIPAFELNSL